MVVQILLNILVQLMCFVGAMYLAGFLIYLFNRIFYSSFGNSRAVCYATGFIGTPIHELSHALFCLLFFHRINEIKFFQIDDESGTLGYVNHSYNRRNLYQRAGNFFIGVAPIVGGTLVLLLAARLLLPDVYGKIAEVLSGYARGGATVQTTFSALGGVLAAFFGGYADPLWWVFLVLAMMIALHMNLSGADIKGSLSGLPFYLIILVALNFIFGYLPGGLYASFLFVVDLAAGYLIITLVLSLIFSVVYVAVGLAVRGILALFKIGR